MNSNNLPHILRITNNKIDFTECRAVDGGMEGAFYGTGILVGDYYKEGCEYSGNHVIAALGYDFERLDADGTATGALISGNTYTIAARKYWNTNQWSNIGG